jgi:NTE family protein
MAREGVALCLSGGGYRAMLFHLGALRRLNELGWLRRLDFVTSVSGGSITAGVLARQWFGLRFDGRGVATNLDIVVDPLLNLAGRTIDVGSVLSGVLRPRRSVGDQVRNALAKHLLGNTDLQQLPDHPRFIFLATNLQTGALWRFSKPYMRDYKVGAIATPHESLALAVSASAAFPPVLSPVTLKIAPERWSHVEPDERGRPRRPPTEVVLSDAGVYDNLGLEAVQKRCAMLLVSDGGGRLQQAGDVPRDWPRHLKRILDVVDNQVRSQRKRHLIESFERREFTGTYWGIWSDIDRYPAAHRLRAPVDLTEALAHTPTRLARLSRERQRALINWGYAVSDAALRSWVSPEAPPPHAFPYPDQGIRAS